MGSTQKWKCFSISVGLHLTVIPFKYMVGEPKLGFQKHTMWFYFLKIANTFIPPKEVLYPSRCVKSFFSILLLFLNENNSILKWKLQS